MAVKVRLKDRVEFLIESPIEDFQKTVHLALCNNQMIEVQNSKGKTHFLNPFQIVFYEEASEPS